VLLQDSHSQKEAFRVNVTTHRKLARRKARILKRLRPRRWAEQLKPMLSARNIAYELADRDRAVNCGGIGAVHLLARHVGLARLIDRDIHVLKRHLPYHESDHVLSLAYNAMVGGTSIEDLERLRNDEAYLDALGAARIPDPTTAGDFCRRFQSDEQILSLMEAINQARLNVWRQQEPAFFRQAVIDADGTIAPTSPLVPARLGMNISYDGQWGDRAGTKGISLANTKEPLYLVNRPGNRPSHEQADVYLDRAVALCRQAGFKSILLRGDTDFTQTWKLDEWDEAGDITFLFGADASPGLVARAQEIPAADWRRLRRPAKYEVKTEPRARPDNVKEQIVREKGYKNLVLQWEDVAEIEHRPVACRKSYRLVVLRKKISVEQGQQKLFEEYRYFFHITNDRGSTDEQIVFSANDRCDQPALSEAEGENLIEQLKNGVGSMRNPEATRN